MSKLHIELIPSLSDNYIFGMHWNGHAAVVDPAVATDVEAWLSAHNVRLEHILITHHHADHTDGNLALKEKWSCPITGPDDSRVPGLDQRIKDGDHIQVGPFSFEVFETPGHTSSHISLYCASEKALFCGDTLFAGGCGRLFEGTPADMYNSMQKLMQLPDETRVYCGHEYTESNLAFAVKVDPDNAALRQRYETVKQLRVSGDPTIPSSIGEERATNVFARAESVEELGRLRALKDQG